MSRFIKNAVAIAAACFSFACAAADQDLYQLNPCPDSLTEQGNASPSRQWDLSLSPYAHHWSYSAEHKNVFLGGLDRYVQGNRFCGLALFRNSFGQPSAYGYVGQRWDGVLGNPKLFSKVSAGLIYGYRGKYKNKIPLNDLGVAPAIIPSIGYAFTPQDSAQIVLLGTAGVLFSYGHSF